MTFDLIIRGGTLIDGTGAPRVCADAGVAGGVIRAVGDLAGAESRAALDAAGLVVCPGFIDAHSHSDAYLLLEPSSPSKVFQGITTEVVGNCGASAAPRLGAARMPSDWAAHDYGSPWRTMAEYRARLAAARPAVNVVALVGHNTLRASVMGYEGRAASPDEVAAMERLLEQCLDEGARGLSTGLLYAPGMFAEPGEVMRLAAAVGRRGGVYATHMRSEGAGLLDSLDETLGLCRRSGARVQVSHLKTSGKANWPLIDAALGRLRAARAEGLPVAADRYPYTASCTDLDVLLPAWAAGGGREAVLARLRSSAERARIRAEILRTRAPDYWDIVVIGSTVHPDNRAFRGQPIRKAAADLAMEPVDAALHLMETDALGTSAFFCGMSEANMWRILAEPWVMLGTDASLRAPGGALGQDYPHPRAYGSCPRFLRAVLDGKSVGLEEAVRKMTSLPAAQFGLTGRGRIAAGCAADLAVFSPERLRDAATFGYPHRLAEGIEHLVVNGVVTIERGRFTGARGGVLV